MWMRMCLRVSVIVKRHVAMETLIRKLFNSGGSLTVSEVQSYIIMVRSMVADMVLATS